MSQYLKEKLEGIVKRYNSEMEDVLKLEKAHRSQGYYTGEHINNLVKEEKEKVKNKFGDEIKLFHSEIKKSVEDYNSFKLKSLFPDLTNSSFRLNGELQIGEGNRKALEFLSDDSPLKYGALVNELNESSILGRIDYVSQVLNKLQPVFDQLESQHELKNGEKKLVEFRNNHFKKTGAQEYIDKINSSNVIEEKTRRLYSEVYHGEEFIILPDVNSSNGTDSLIVGEQLNRLSKVPSL